MRATVLVLLLGVASSGQALADQTVQAREHFALGVAHYEAGRYVQALEHFQLTYNLRAHPAVLVNLANCYMRLNRFAEAALHFERALSESRNLEEDQRRAITQALEDSRAHLGEILLAIEPPGAQVRVDGRTVGRSPFSRPLMVPEGTHRLEARLSGHETATRELTVEPRMTVQWRVALARVSTSTAPALSSLPGPSSAPTDAQRAILAVHSSRPGRPVRVGGVEVGRTPWEGEVPAGSPRVQVGDWSGPVHLAEGQRGQLDIEAGRTPPDRRTGKLILGSAVWGGMMLGALVTGALAMSAQSDFDEIADDIQANGRGMSQERYEARRQEGVDTADALEAWSTSSDVLLGLSLASAAATFVYYLLAAPTPGPPTARFELGLTPGGAGLTGQF